MCSGEGWWVGSLYPPDFWSSPVAWEVLLAEIQQFDSSVREGITALGVDPAFIPGV